MAPTKGSNSSKLNPDTIRSTRKGRAMLNSKGPQQYRVEKKNKNCRKFSRNNASGRAVMTHDIGDQKHETHNAKIIQNNHYYNSPSRGGASTTGEFLGAVLRSPADSVVDVEDGDEISRSDPKHAHNHLSPRLPPRPIENSSSQRHSVQRSLCPSPSRQHGYSKELTMITNSFNDIQRKTTWADTALKSISDQLLQPFAPQVKKLERLLTRLNAAQGYCPSKEEIEDYSRKNNSRLYKSQERMESIAKISRIMQSACVGSDRLHEQMERISHNLLLGSKDNAAMTDDFLRCIEITGSIDNDLISFQEEFDCLSGMKKSEKPIQEDEARHKIQNFEISRDFSLRLCGQLSTICHLHKAHDIYFNLDTEYKVEQKSETGQQHEVEFHLAVQRSGRPVWLKAEPMTHNPSNLGSVADRHVITSFKPDEYMKSMTRTISGATFCLGELRSGMEFMFRIGRFNVQHPDPRVRDERHAMTLTEWITTHKSSTYPRLRLARLVAEATLKFDTELWCWTDLEADKFLIVPPLKYENLESHICISLESHENRQLDRRSKPMRADEVFIRLGIIFLELAYRKKLQRPKIDNNGVPDRNCSAFHAILEMAHDENLQSQMTDKYAGVVKYCILRSSSETYLHDHQAQMELYQKVIGVLRREEEYQADSFSEVAKIAQGGGPVVL